MKRVKPLSLYLPPELRSRVEVIAEERKRGLSPQIEVWVERAVARIERKRIEAAAQKRNQLCPA